MAVVLRTQLDRELADLSQDVLELGSWAVHAVAQSLQAYSSHEVDLAREVIRGDDTINRRRLEIERDCYALLATEQPVARDLRAIVSALTIVNDLERIGDHGKRIAKICLLTWEHPRPVPTCEIPYLGQMALAMVDRSLRAYATCDTQEALAVCQADDEVDAFYRQCFNVVLSYMLENPRLIGAGTHLLQIAHELERVADHATNVSERVIYAVTGELIDLNV